MITIIRKCYFRDQKCCNMAMESIEWDISLLRENEALGFCYLRQKCLDPSKIVLK
jgi:hypothetical protein